MESAGMQNTDTDAVSMTGNTNIAIFVGFGWMGFLF
jgi:hypothetical protein